MIIRATERVFIDGALREAGEEFEASRVWNGTEIVDQGDEAEAAKPRRGRRPAATSQDEPGSVADQDVI